MESKIFAFLVLAAVFSTSFCAGLNFLTFNLTHINLEEPDVPLTGELHWNAEYFKTVLARRKRMACLVQVRNWLVLGAENATVSANFYSTLKETKLNKTLVFNKIVAVLATNCQKYLTEQMIDEIMTPERVLMLHPNYNTFLTYDKEFFLNPNSTINFSEEENLYLREVFESEKPAGQPNQVAGNQTAKGEDFSELIRNEFFLFGMAVTRPYVLSFMGIGFGVTTVFLIFFAWLLSLCFGNKNDDDEEIITPGKPSPSKRRQ